MFSPRKFADKIFLKYIVQFYSMPVDHSGKKKGTLIIDCTKFPGFYADMKSEPKY